MTSDELVTGSASVSGGQAGSRLTVGRACRSRNPGRPTRVCPRVAPRVGQPDLVAAGPESTLTSSGFAALHPIVGRVGGFW